MKHVFYFVWLLYFMRELQVVFNPFKQMSLVKDLHNKQRKNRIKLKWEDLDQDQKGQIKTIMFIHGPALIFKYVGLFSFNWFLFLIWIIVGLIISPIGKELNHRFENKTSVLMFYTSTIALFEASMALLVILNSYHLFIDNTALFKQILAHF